MIQYMALSAEISSPVLSEIFEPFPTSGVIYSKDSTSCQAEFMGNISGFPLTHQIQLELYRALRDTRLESDQVVYAEVLEKTGGLVEQFKALYPHIFNRI